MEKTETTTVDQVRSQLLQGIGEAIASSYSDELKIQIITKKLKNAEYDIRELVSHLSKS